MYREKMHLSIVSSAKILQKSSFSVAASARFVAELLLPVGLIFSLPPKIFLFYSKTYT